MNSKRSQKCGLTLFEHTGSWRPQGG